MESKVNFVCCDNPHATPFTLHILAAVAEQEAKQISQRVKDTMAVLRAKGRKLGTPENLTQEARLKQDVIDQTNSTISTLSSLQKSEQQRLETLRTRLRQRQDRAKRIANRLEDVATTLLYGLP